MNTVQARLRKAVPRLRILLAAVAVLTLGVPWVQPVAADSTIAVSASNVEIMQTQFGPGETFTQPVLLLKATVTTTSTADLVIQFVTECNLLTDVITPTSQAAAAVIVWVEIDGTRVAVTNLPARGGPDNGEVHFCSRDYRVITSLPLLPPAFIELFNKTKSTHSFNWVALDLAPGVHTVAVQAQLGTLVSGFFGTAQAGVGKRVLIIKSIQLASDATI